MFRMLGDFVLCFLARAIDLQRCAGYVRIRVT